MPRATHGGDGSDGSGYAYRHFPSKTTNLPLRGCRGELDLPRGGRRAVYAYGSLRGESIHLTQASPANYVADQPGARRFPDRHGSYRELFNVNAPGFRDTDVPEVFRAANGGVLDVRGAANVAVDLNGARYVHQFLVAGLTINILGFDFLHANRLCLLYDPLRLEPYRDEWG